MLFGEITYNCTNKKGLQMQSLSYSMAESQGFEPWVRSSPHT